MFDEKPGPGFAYLVSAALAFYMTQYWVDPWARDHLAREPATVAWLSFIIGWVLGSSLIFVDRRTMFGDRPPPS